MPVKFEDLIPSYKRFFESFHAVRICPRRIDASEETLSFNILTLAVAIVIFVIARSTTTADNDAIAPQLVAMAISALITFTCGYAVLIFAPAPDGIMLSKKWANFFVHVWLGSLIALIVIDGIAIWTGHDRITTLLIDSVFIPGSLTAVREGRDPRADLLGDRARAPADQDRAAGRRFHALHAVLGRSRHPRRAGELGAAACFCLRQSAVTTRIAAR